MERCDGSELGKKIYARKVKKAARENRLNFDIASMPESKEWFWRMCNARMMLGYYKDYMGWQFRNDWATRLWYEPQCMNTPMWKGEQVDKLIIMGEQGIGDEIMFAQCIRDTIAHLGHRNIVFETTDRMIPIFERSFGIKCKERGSTEDKRDAPWICLGDLLRIFRTGVYFDGSPYLSPSPDRTEEFEWARGKIAVSWEGRHGRYDPEAFADAFLRAGIPLSEVIDLQYNDTFDGFVQPGIDKLNDLEGVLGILSVCSRLVSVSTTVVHLAAASGVPVHLVIAPKNTGPNYDQLQWRWGIHDERTKWYDSVRIFRSLKLYESLYLRHTKKSRPMPSFQSSDRMAIS